MPPKGSVAPSRGSIIFLFFWSLGLTPQANHLSPLRGSSRMATYRGMQETLNALVA